MSKQGWIFSFLLPLLAIVIILVADTLEGPKTAFVGVLAVVPMLAAVFGTPMATMIVSAVTLIAAAGFGLVASDGNAPAQNVRLIIITIVSLIAVWASRQRQLREHERTTIQIEAARADILEKQLHTDLLTGVLNRRGLEASGTNANTPSYFIMIDCDGLKKVNDSFGHAVGDEYLSAVAGRLGNAFSNGELVGRWGGDEFVVLSSVSSEKIEETVTAAIDKVMGREIHTEAGLIPCKISVGVAPWQERRSIQEIMMSADEAMFAAKKRPGGKAVVFQLTN